MDILRTVFEKPEEAEKAYVQPNPKRRKLRIVPLKFDDSSEPASSSLEPRLATSRGESNQEYLELV